MLTRFLVADRSSISVCCRTWAVYKGGVYDLSDYMSTVTYHKADTDGDKYSFLNSAVVAAFQNGPGRDITKPLEKAFAAMGDEAASQQFTCLKNAFYVGASDFRKTARCTANNYILLAFSVLIMLTIFVKCESL